MTMNPNGASNSNWGGELDGPKTMLGGIFFRSLRAWPDMTKLRS
jgi:hypothetical protein